MDCSPPGSPVHGILQGRILDWVAIPFSRGYSWPREQTWVSHISRQIFYRLSHQEIPIAEEADPKINLTKFSVKEFIICVFF